MPAALHCVTDSQPTGGKPDRAGARKKMRERGILNGQERIKERRKVGGSVVGQIRLTEQGRRW